MNDNIDLIVTKTILLCCCNAIRVIIITMMKLLLPERVNMFSLLLVVCSQLQTEAFQQKSLSVFQRKHHTYLPRDHLAPFPSSASCPTAPTQTISRLDRTSLSTSLWTTVDALWKMNPYAAAGVVCGIKACAADLVAQQRQIRMHAAAAVADHTPSLQQSEQTRQPRNIQTLDARRNLAFLIYGVLYQGIGQEVIYNHLYPILFGSGTDMTTVFRKVIFDLCIQTTFLTLPIAYYSKSVVFGRPFKVAMQQYVDDVKHKGLLTKYFLLWGPVQSLTFSVIPEHFRITFIASVSFFWVIILSSLSSGNRDSITVASDVSLTVDAGRIHNSASESAVPVTARSLD